MLEQCSILPRSSIRERMFVCAQRSFLLPVRTNCCSSLVNFVSRPVPEAPHAEPSVHVRAQTETMARCNKKSTGLDPFIRKESLVVLAKMGFGKREPQHGPHRYHGVAARTRLALAGKVGRLRSLLISCTFSVRCRENKPHDVVDACRDTTITRKSDQNDDMFRCVPSREHGTLRHAHYFEEYR